jgi:hypothetical protein
MAHNFGCHHDRQTEGASGDDQKPSYGFRFNYRGADTGTVMSYAANRVPYFSNPNISYNGIALGVPDDQPNPAFNARVLSANAPMMAAYRDESKAPVITAQPQPVTVPQGADLNLSVSAVGDGLSFQWQKNGIALPGATASVYSKAAASEADGGIYSVVVSNNAGQAASDGATVAVATQSAPSASPTNTGESASSGGGGAVEPWVLAMLAALYAVRRLSSGRRG